MISVMIESLTTRESTRCGSIESPLTLMSRIAGSITSAQRLAKRSWKLDASKQSYYYVLDDQQVPLAPSAETIEQVEETAVKVAEGIRAQRFDPTPSYAACSICDFQLICPAAEK